MPAMAKKKPTSPGSSDRHKPRRSVALPPELVDLVEALAEKNRRPLVWEIRIALEEHLRAAKMWPPPEETKEG